MFARLVKAVVYTRADFDRPEETSILNTTCVCKLLNAYVVFQNWPAYRPRHRESNEYKQQHKK